MRRGLLAPLLLLLVSVGCGQASGAAHHSTSSIVALPPTQSGYQAAVQRPWYKQGMHSGGFQSPTGNIRCGPNSKDPTELLCETLNNGSGATLALTGPVDTSWTVTIGKGWPTLHYRHYWSSRYFWCDSEFKGTFCRSLYSRQGFLINRDSIQSYVWQSAPLHLANSGGGYGYSGGTTGSGMGYEVFCADGTISFSGGIQGACSDHGGVAGDSSGGSSGGVIPGGTGYEVTCMDGTISYSGGVQGACSYHGGVAP
jgi:hypothetical protein